jgi:hypothetical protein
VSAVHALKLARAFGVRIRINGDALTLEADAGPPSAVLELLVRRKAQVIELLRPGGDGWSARIGAPSSINVQALPSSTAACHAIRPRPAPSPAALPNGSTTTRGARRPVAATVAARLSTAKTRWSPSVLNRPAMPGFIRVARPRGTPAGRLKLAPPFQHSRSTRRGHRHDRQETCQRADNRGRRRF